ncbi:MAG: dihydrolipoyl dehydrogenase [Deltaproteobacteria bacterium]|nr:dihydrolipoyl dehydrogenase [Deltaproteobacteria bacterium]
MKGFDIIVIGGGPAGYVAAIRAAQKGAKACLVERLKLGGTCLNRGCIPTKALYYSAKTLSMVKRAHEFGVEAACIDFRLEKAVARKDEVVGKLVSGVGQLLKANGIEVINGSGVIESAGKVRVVKTDGVLELGAKKGVIIATGSEPAMIPTFKIDRENILTSTEMLDLKKVPESLLIIGGGVMGSEFATIFSRFGSKVIIVELLPTILSTEDKQIVRVILKGFKDMGIEVCTDVKVEDVEVTGEGVKTMLSDGRTFTTEKVMVSIGRSFNSDGLGLEAVGVNMDKGRVLVNEKMETSIRGIYAAGDVTGGILLAHVASVEGTVAVTNALGGNTAMDYSVIPAGVFTDPEIASVGLKEKDTEAKGIDVRIGRFPYAGSGKALAMAGPDGFVQIVADRGTDKVLGASIVGAHATDLIGEVALAVKAGLKIKDIIETVHAHPTLPELVLEAAEDAHGEAVHKVGRKR